MKLAHKISISFFAAAFVLASSAAAIFYVIAKNSLRGAIFSDLVVACSSRTSHIETYLKMLEISVGQLSKSMTLGDLLKVNSKEDPRYGEVFGMAMKRLKKTKEANPSIYEFLLMDKTGKVVASSNENNIGLDNSSDVIFLGAQKEIYLKDAYLLEPSKEPLMAVSAPFLDSQTGELLGVLAARVMLTELSSITTDTTGLGNTGEIYIINKYGYMVTPSRFKKNTFLKQKTDKEAFCFLCHDTMTHRADRVLSYENQEGVLSAHKMAYVFPNYLGTPVLGAYKYVPEMQWGVLAEMDEKEAFGPLVQLRLVFFLIIFIVPIVSWILGLGIAGAITKPLHKLRKGTEIIGNGHLDYKVGTNDDDEVGQLSRAFDVMTRNLNNTTTSIENLNKEISERRKAHEEAENKNKALEEANKNLALNDRALKNILYDLKKASDDLKSSQARLIQSEKLASIGQLAAGVAHEVKNPLAIILLAVESLESILKASGEKGSRYIVMIKDAAERANKVVVGLLNFSRQSEPHFEPLDVREIIQRTVSLAVNTARIKNINIVSKDDSNSKLVVNGDGDQLGQVLLNLFSNAFDAIGSNGTVTVKTHLLNAGLKSEARIVIEVSDTGLGMSPEIIPKIFDPFFTTKEPGVGTGLGLSIVSMILQRHGGTIEVKSTQNVGTTFMMTFPRYLG